MWVEFVVVVEEEASTSLMGAKTHKSIRYLSLQHPP